MTDKRLLIGERLSTVTLQHLLHQIVDFVHQTVHVVMRPVPFQHGEFRVVVTSRLFIAEAARHLIDRATARRQQAFHMIFRAGHQPEIAPLRSARPDKTRLEWHQMDIGNGGLAHRRRIHFQHAAIGKETTHFC